MSKNRTIEEIIQEYEQEYRRFMRISSFPDYRIEKYVYVPGKTIAKAQAKYDYRTKGYVVRVCENIELSRNTIFHEFTHILDNEAVNGTDFKNYLFSTGFTEYHASQVALLELLGCKSYQDDTFRFSMNDQCADYPSVMEYILDRRMRFINDMKSITIPNDIEVITSELGILFNYLGFVSICRMYAIDYVENQDDKLFAFFSNDEITDIKKLMVGWLDDNKVHEAMLLFKRIIAPLVLEQDKKDLAAYGIFI